MSTTLIAPLGPDWEWGDRLRKVRRNIAGCTQAEMASQLGVTLPTYQAWEAGRNEPNHRDVIEISEIISSWWPERVSIQWMLGLAPRVAGDGEAVANVRVSPSSTPPSGRGGVVTSMEKARRRTSKVNQLPRMDSNHQPSGCGQAPELPAA